MDIRLCCVEAGEGFPLVLLHGNGEDHTYFKRQMGPFSQHFRVIAVDTRGHGESPRGTAPFTLEQFAEDLKEFLDGRSIDPMPPAGLLRRGQHRSAVRPEIPGVCGKADRSMGRTCAPPA